jgi:hypothetical protein
VERVNEKKQMSDGSCRRECIFDERDEKSLKNDAGLARAQKEFGGKKPMSEEVLKGAKER